MADETPQTPATPATQAADSPATQTPAATTEQGQQGTLLTGENTEGQTEGEAKPGAEGENTEGQEAEKPAGAPEKYEFKVPDGAQLEGAVLEQYAEVAKELDLSQEAAQKIVDKIAPALAQRQAETIKAAQDGWLTATKADPDIGGAKLNESVALAQKALVDLGTPELKTLLDQSGLGNHPEVVRMLAKAGKAISEDSFVGGKALPTQDAALSRLYPSQNK